MLVCKKIMLSMIHAIHRLWMNFLCFFKVSSYARDDDVMLKPLFTFLFHRLNYSSLWFMLWTLNTSKVMMDEWLALKTRRWFKKDNTRVKRACCLESNFEFVNYKWITKDIWLVNLIKRLKIHFEFPKKFANTLKTIAKFMNKDT